MATAHWTLYRKENTWVVQLDEGQEADTGETVTVRKKDGSTQQVVLGESLGMYRMFRKAEQQPEGQQRPQQPVVTADEATQNRTALLGRLDPDQRQVAAWDGRSNQRIVAAAGSGKTTTVVAMVTNLLESGVRPESLIVTTFTSKAGQELHERLAKVVTAGVLAQMKVGTFHGLALRALRAADPQGWNMARCVDSGRGRARDIPAASTLWIRACEPGRIQVLGGEEGMGIPKEDAGDYKLAVEALCLSRGFRHDSAEGKAAADKAGLPQLHAVWSLYERQKRAHNAFDFSDALFALRDYLRTNTATRECVVVVDEAQDNSALQIEIAELLAGRGKVMLVGDVRQSIYGWRGAAPELFLSADKRIGASTLYLPNNYRSGSSIVELGNRIAAGQSWSLGPPAKASRDSTGEITVTGYGNIDDVSDSVAREVAAKVRDGSRPDAFAILCRTRAEQGSYEAALLAHQVPVAIVGGSSFFASRVWRDYSAVLAAVCGTATQEQVERAVGTAPGVGGWTGKDVAQRYATSHDFASALEDTADAMRHRTRREALYHFMKFVRDARGLDFSFACEAVGVFMCENVPKGDGDSDGRSEVMAASKIAARFDNVGEALRFAARCEGSALALSEDAKDEAAQGRVCISTIHKAKGREWAHVFCDVSAMRFPHARSIDDEKRLAEEQRLFYVAVTRAADTLKLSHCAEVNEKPAGPSPFLDFCDRPDGGGGGKKPEAPKPSPAPVTTAVKRVTPESLAADALEVMEKHHGHDAVVDDLHDANPSFLPDPKGFLQPATPVVTSEDTVSSLKLALEARQPVAETLTAAGVQPLPGQRFVPVTLQEFEELLGPVGFESDGPQSERAGQHVMTFHVTGGCKVCVHTTIPVGESAARGLGEDSIRFTLLGPDGKPRMKRQPYSARTKNWRSTVVSRLLEVVSRFGEPCATCGAPTTEKTAKESGKVFHGCVRYPECRGFARR